MLRYLWWMEVLTMRMKVRFRLKVEALLGPCLIAVMYPER